MQHLRIVTLNLWAQHGLWPMRAAAIQAELLAQAPAVVALQEVLGFSGGRTQLDELCARLPPELYPYRAHGPACALPGERTFGNALLSRFPILVQRNLALPNPRRREPRALLCTLLALPAGHLPVFVTHLDWELDGSPARCQQVRFIADQIDAFIAAAPRPPGSPQPGAAQADVLPAILAGEKIAALAVTEPSGGSDVASLKTTAIREGDHYVVNGEKTFITSGIRADYLTVAVRTNPADKGAGGISFLLVEGDTPGLTRTPLKKMGWWVSDTAHLYFENCRVPVANLIGEENQGFRLIMRNFNSERLGLAASAYGFAKVCFEDALAWARERKTFGQPLIERQVVRHKLVDMAMKIDAVRAWLEDLTWRAEHQTTDANLLVAQICMLKNLSTQTMQFCADQAVQMLGGMGYMRGERVERIYRDVKVYMIGGGAEEIMKDLAARQMRF